MPPFSRSLASLLAPAFFLMPNHLRLGESQPSFLPLGSCSGSDWKGLAFGDDDAGAPFFGVLGVLGAPFFPADSTLGSSPASKSGGKSITPFPSRGVEVNAPERKLRAVCSLLGELGKRASARGLTMTVPYRPLHYVTYK